MGGGGWPFSWYYSYLVLGSYGETGRWNGLHCCVDVGSWFEDAIRRVARVWRCGLGLEVVLWFEG